jgi:hypothetical protein
MLIHDQPIKADLLNGDEKLVEIDWFLNVAVSTQGVASREILLLA